MYISKEVFLSEASWRIEPRLGFVNLVNAPMASGKTTWARNFNAEGITLLLVPTSGFGETVGSCWVEICES